MPMTALINDPGFRALVDRFRDDLPARLAEMREAANEGRSDDLQRLAHQLKGAGGGLGFPQLTSPAGRVEAVAAGGAPSSELSEALDAFAEICGSICEQPVR